MYIITTKSDKQNVLKTITGGKRIQGPQVKEKKKKEKENKQREKLQRIHKYK